jgi:hypothetical protein
MDHDEASQDNTRILMTVSTLAMLAPAQLNFS